MKYPERIQRDYEVRVAEAKHKAETEKKKLLDALDLLNGAHTPTKGRYTMDKDGNIHGPSK